MRTLNWEVPGVQSSISCPFGRVTVVSGLCRQTGRVIGGSLRLIAGRTSNGQEGKWQEEEGCRLLGPHPPLNAPTASPVHSGGGRLGSVNPNAGPHSPTTWEGDRLRERNQEGTRPGPSSTTEPRTLSTPCTPYKGGGVKESPQKPP